VANARGALVRVSPRRRRVRARGAVPELGGGPAFGAAERFSRGLGRDSRLGRAEARKLFEELFEEVSRGTSPDDSKQASSRLALKRAFRAAALRWHPDKFAQTFAARLAAAPAAPRAALERRVAETFRDVREAYERMERTETNDDD
jgi:hypothetical protein